MKASEYAFPSATIPGNLFKIRRLPNGDIRLDSAVSDRFILFSNLNDYAMCRQVAFAMLALTEKDDENDST